MKNEANKYIDGIITLTEDQERLLRHLIDQQEQEEFDQYASQFDSSQEYLEANVYEPKQ